MPADSPSVGELWLYDGYQPLPEDYWRGRSHAYCLVVEADGRVVTARYFRSAGRWALVHLRKEEFIQAFVFVPILPGLDHDAIVFIENMASLGQSWVAKRESRKLSDDEPSTVVSRTQWQHLLDNDESV
jgi:hypothetical protein